MSTLKFTVVVKNCTVKWAERVLQTLLLMQSLKKFLEILKPVACALFGSSLRQMNWCSTEQKKIGGGGGGGGGGGVGLKAQVRNTCVQMQHITRPPPLAPPTW